jgi:hypothetical protein
MPPRATYMCAAYTAQRCWTVRQTCTQTSRACAGDLMRACTAVRDIHASVVTTCAEELIMAANTSCTCRSPHVNVLKPYSSRVCNWPAVDRLCHPVRVITLSAHALTDAGAQPGVVRAGQLVLAPALDQVEPALQALAGAGLPQSGSAMHILVLAPTESESAGSGDTVPLTGRSPSCATAGGLRRIGSEVEWATAAPSPGIDDQLTSVLAACKQHAAALGVQELSFLISLPSQAPYHACFRHDELCGLRRLPDWTTFDLATAAATEADNLPPTLAHVPSRAYRVHSFIVQVRSAWFICETYLCCR